MPTLPKHNSCLRGSRHQTANGKIVPRWTCRADRLLCQPAHKTPS
jgi:hypothetical protein